MTDAFLTPGAAVAVRYVHVRRAVQVARASRRSWRRSVRIRERNHGFTLCVVALYYLSDDKNEL